MRNNPFWCWFFLGNFLLPIAKIDLFPVGVGDLWGFFSLFGVGDFSGIFY